MSIGKHESGFWAEIKRALGSRPLHDLVRVENGTCGPGTPDLNYCIDGIEGWIELKKVELPKRDSTVVKVDHFVGEQRAWLMRRATAGGRVWVLLRAGDETFLFSGGHAARNLGVTWTKEDCRTRAVYHCAGRVGWDRLVQELIS